MRVELFEAFRRAAAAEATQVVVYDRFGLPAVVVAEPAPGVITVLVKGDPGFAEACGLVAVWPGDPPAAARFPAPPGGVTV